jgi:hypothetical protein
MPQTLDQRAAASTEKEGVAGERISFEMLLHQQRKARHPFAHIRVPGRDPNPNPTRDGDHRSARNVASTRATGAVTPIRTVVPGLSSIEIAASDTEHGAVACPSSLTIAGTKVGVRTPK